MKNNKHNNQKYHNFYDRKKELDSYEKLIEETTMTWYENKHPSTSVAEVKLINEIDIKECPFCGSKSIVKFGKRKDGIQTYKCNSCNKRFNPLTNTIFDNRKIPISEWIEFIINIIGYSSGNKAALINQNSITTGFFWIEKFFMVLEGVQDNIKLDGDVFIDEMFFNKPSKKSHNAQKGLRGISRNKMCVACGTNKKEIILLDANCSKFTYKSCENTYCKHIKEGSTIYADDEKAHNKLYKTINVMTCIFNSEVLKSESSNTNPLKPINNLHSLVREFFKRHKNFKNTKLQDWLNLARFVLTPSMSLEMKVKFFLKRAISSSSKLRYRQFYSKKFDNNRT